MPTSFQKYEFSDKGKRTKNKLSQQGVRGIFVGLPDDSDGWLFYVPGAKRTFTSIDAVFDPDTRPLSTHKRGEELIKVDTSDNISAFFTSMSRPSDDSLSFPEYLNVAHELNQM